MKQTSDVCCYSLMQGSIEHGGAWAVGDSMRAVILLFIRRNIHLVSISVSSSELLKPWNFQSDKSLVIHLLAPFKMPEFMLMR